MKYSIIMKNCRLCSQEAELQASHIIPSFVGRWIKETSVTGFLRQVVNPNLRLQDIIKKHLLCKKCEVLFSAYEDQFANRIFYPYVNQELDEWGVAKGEIKFISYEEWLLKFIVSLQWRALITYSTTKDMNLTNDDTHQKFKLLIDQALSNWSNYLLGITDISGDERHYIIFLQNLASGRGSLPERINDNVNTYLLRSVDTTLAYSNNSLFLYTKMGPIILMTGLKPYIIKDMNNIAIKKHGRISITQNLKNTFINEFIFVTRPNETFSRYVLSEKQEKKIATDIESKVKTSKHLHSVLTSYSDFLLRKKKISNIL